MAMTAAPSREAITGVINKYFDAISAMDADAFVACYAADGASHDPEGAPPHVGEAGLREFFTGIATLCESTQMTAEEPRISGTAAAVAWHLTARSRTGKEASADGIDTFSFSGDGLIQESHGYWDPEPFIGALTS